jgi:neuronal calcium sensor 1
MTTLLGPQQATPPPTSPNVTMPHGHEDHDSEGGTSHHISLGDNEVPLLSHDHPPLHFARPRPLHIPQPGEPGYDNYLGHRERAFEMGVKSMEHELASKSPVDHVVLEVDRLILQFHSQSKLSQQELADLQKATHFDKKELQQWYKGTILQRII